uniref:Uncharacterized protein n=1 Tax=Ixodes ricinus TaxID=34613 RepID=A0A6B0UL04_IXORI
MGMAVAAAASVPSSLTSTKALWMTSEAHRFPVALMPERSARGVKKSLTPIAISTSFKPMDCSSLNFGKRKLTSDFLYMPLSRADSFGAVKCSSRTESPSTSLGRRMTIDVLLPL